MKVLFKKEDIIGISQDLQPSNTATKNLSHDIRVVTGNRKSIESHTGKKSMRKTISLMISLKYVC